MERAMNRAGIASLSLAGVGLALLHILPTPHLYTTTGRVILYQPWNFLSEYARTDYAPLMILCFFLLSFGTLTAAVALRHLRREAILLTLAGAALLLLIFFPTDLADLTTDAVTCGQLERIEPCTVAGRIHNPLSTMAFVPVLLVILSICVRGRREPQWRNAARLAAACGIMALFGLIATNLCMHLFDWHGRLWTGLTQRSLVFPALVWMAGLLATTKDTLPGTA